MTHWSGPYDVHTISCWFLINLMDDPRLLLCLFRPRQLGGTDSGVTPMTLMPQGILRKTQYLIQKQRKLNTVFWGLVMWNGSWDHVVISLEKCLSEGISTCSPLWKTVLNSFFLTCIERKHWVKRQCIWGSSWYQRMWSTELGIDRLKQHAHGIVYGSSMNQYFFSVDIHQPTWCVQTDDGCVRSECMFFVSALCLWFVWWLHPQQISRSDAVTRSMKLALMLDRWNRSKQHRNTPHI